MRHIYDLHTVIFLQPIMWWTATRLEPMDWLSGEISSAASGYAQLLLINWIFSENHWTCNEKNKTVSPPIRWFGDFHWSLNDFQWKSSWSFFTANPMIFTAFSVIFDEIPYGFSFHSQSGGFHCIFSDFRWNCSWIFFFTDNPVIFTAFSELQQKNIQRNEFHRQSSCFSMKMGLKRKYWCNWALFRNQVKPLCKISIRLWSKPVFWPYLQNFRFYTNKKNNCPSVFLTTLEKSYDPLGYWLLGRFCQKSF